MAKSAKGIDRVEVEWLDAAAYIGYFGSEKSAVPGDLNGIGVIHRSVGWKVRDDKTGVVIALTQVIGPDGGPQDHRMCLEIPRPYIRKVSVLK